MAKITQITVRNGKKMGLPGYSSVDYSAEVTVTLEEGEKYSDVIKYAWHVVETEVEKRIAQYAGGTGGGE